MATAKTRALSTKPVGLASCLWLVRTVRLPCFVMASGHDLTFHEVVMNIVILALTIMAIDRVRERYVFYH